LGHLIAADAFLIATIEVAVRLKPGGTAGRYKGRSGTRWTGQVSDVKGPTLAVQRTLESWIVLGFF
jgi:hypothetical protein